VKSATKDLILSLDAGSQEDTVRQLNETKSAIDNAAKKGVIHRNTAARKVSRLSKLVNNSNA